MELSQARNADPSIPFAIPRAGLVTFWSASIEAPHGLQRQQLQVFASSKCLGVCLCSPARQGRGICLRRLGRLVHGRCGTNCSSRVRGRHALSSSQARSGRRSQANARRPPPRRRLGTRPPESAAGSAPERARCGPGLLACHRRAAPGVACLPPARGPWGDRASTSALSLGAGTSAAFGSCPPPG